MDGLLRVGRRGRRRERQGALRAQRRRRWRPQATGGRVTAPLWRRGAGEVGRSIGAKRWAARKWTNHGLRPPPSLAPYVATPHAPPARVFFRPAGEASSSSASSSRTPSRRRGDEEEARVMRIALALALQDAEDRTGASGRRWRPPLPR
jgi:hypothetical protein